jgi:predicted RNA-binding Zn ribbon-like protein
MKQANNQEAPGTLEIVRTFLNTWRIPNDTRQPSDEFISLAAMQQFYMTWFGTVAGDAGVVIVPERVRQLRADLRHILGTNDVQVLNAWLARQPIGVAIARDADDQPAFQYRPIGEQECQLCAAVLALVVAAIAHGTWTRLKACPDCQWAFYDHTKNKNKVWCLMNASGPQGRSCGSISKVRNFRARQKALIDKARQP